MESTTKPQLDRHGNITTTGIKKMLPPGIQSNATFGQLFIEMGDLKWLTYDGINFLEDYGKGKKVMDLYANIKFWGEDPASKGIYLKFKNGLRTKRETAVNTYKYQLMVPEPSFERYIDDMGALVIDFYSVQEGLTIGTSKCIMKLFIKREKKAGDMSPLVEMRGTFPITLTGNNNIKIGEFNLSVTSSFANPMSQIGADNQIQINNNNQELSNEDSFVMNEQRAQEQNSRLHAQMAQDERIPSSLTNKAATHEAYNQNAFAGAMQNERPTRGPPSQMQNSNNLTGKADSNFASRKQITIDENDDTVNTQGELEAIMQRGARLQKQMADALNPSTSAWEQIHGMHNVAKTYVPPFIKTEHDEMMGESPEKIKDQIYEMELDEEALAKEDEQPKAGSAKPQLPRRKQVDLDNAQNLEEANWEEQDRRQLKEMKFIRIKVKQMKVDSEDLISKITQKSFTLSLDIPLPDVYHSCMSKQNVTLSNYEPLAHNLFAFNSLSLYNFRVDEKTLGQFVASKMTFGIAEHDVKGTLDMNRLLMSHDFKLEATVELTQKLTTVMQVKVEGRKKPVEKVETQEIYAGTIVVEINLQSGDTEDEMKRNFQIKMQNMEEARAKAENERQEMNRKKLQFVMEQQPVFAQLYLHIDRLGHNDNIGERTEQQIAVAEDPRKKKDENEELTDTLNNRATGTEEEGAEARKPSGSDNTLERDQKIAFPKRNLFFQFKAFPNLEQLKTGTVWQKDEESEFNYRSQFPVLMCPDTLEKMEKFVLVLELWDQISPSVTEFLGLVKVPLAPICYSMKTTDNEIYSLNFLADQFCMYPMTVCDGFLPIYSPKLGQEIAHVKVSLSIGSPVQITRLIQRESDAERRKQRDEEARKVREAEIAKEKEMKEARKAKKEKKRLLEQEKQEREAARQQEEEDNMMNMMGVKPENGGFDSMKAGNSPARIMKQAMSMQLRQSVNSQLQKQDYDQRNSSMLNCMRKLFEEARTLGVVDLNGEEIFKEDIKNFDGTVPKDEMLYSLLNNEKFSLTRIELSQILSLIMNINRDDNGRVDIDEMHFSFKSYIKYYELIEQRIIDMLEKFKLSVSKKFEIQDLINEFVAEIESKAQDSKMSLIQLREIIEDRHGIIIRDAIYDQFALYFDLDRDQNVYITSLCEYIKSPSTRKINFYKVNTTVIANQIADYVKNSCETQPDCISQLEEEFKQEIFKTHQLEVQKKRGESEFPPDPINIKVIPTDLLINEKVNAKLFQFKMKRMGIALSLWEVFTLFEHLNTKHAKMYFEPQRYHHVMFGNFYTFIKNEEYNRVTAGEPQKRRTPTGTEASRLSRSREGREAKESVKTTGHHSRNQSRGHGSNSRGKSAGADGGANVYDIQANGYNRGQQDHQDEESQNESDRGYWHKNDESDNEDPRKPYKQVKHVFEIKVKELKNIPLLNKFICQSANMAEVNALQSAMLDPKQHKIAKSQANKYIQNVAVKYSFPLDEDEILESDYLQLNNDSLDKQGVYNYNVSMDTVHTYILSKEDKIQNVLELYQSRGGSQNLVAQDDDYEDSKQARKEELFNMSIALFQDNREYIIGNAHLPIEDLIETIIQYEGKNGTFDRTTKRSNLNRTLFLYGTTYSQRENCIIGKLQLEVNYSQEKMFLSKREAVVYEEQMREQKQINSKGEGIPANPYSCFMHRETYINRKIPLNAKLSVLIDRCSHLKESIENIEHFSKIQHSALGFDLPQDDELNMLNANLSRTSMVHNRSDTQHLDRRRVLHHILKNGLNLIVRCSMFEEDQELVKKFKQLEQTDSMSNYGKYQTRMLYNSLNPVFGEVFEMNLQMDTKIFEYLKNKRALFEVRHYIIESTKQKQKKMRESYTNQDFNNRVFDDDEQSEHTVVDDEVISECDYIVLGYVRVPLLQLITKNNGVDGDFTIFDEFKQKMGSLRLRITLNHHNSQRPLYSTSSKIPNQVTSGIQQSQTRSSLIEQSINLSSQIKLGTVSRSQLKHQKYILGINFIELLLKNRSHLVKQVQGQVQRFYLKFRMFNQSFQTKFIGGDMQNSLDSLNILLQKIKMQRLDIGKSTFVDLNMADSNLIEQAFGKPLEIQLWHKIESTRTYEKPIKEELLGQFFVELNELSKMTNSRLKEQNENVPGKFQVYEGYFSMHESKRDKITSDRLAMRIYLFSKDDTNESLTLDDMNSIFNNYRPKIERAIASKIDKEGKGYTDSEELIQVVRDEVQDEYVAQKLIWFIKSSLQFKNVDKVFYSPLFGLPPPFFRYAKKFDQIEIICKFNEEFENLDSMENGFIPATILKNVLEGELNLKQKIVDDFIFSLRDIDIENQNEKSNAKLVKEVQSLDVNLITNSLKTSHLDFIVLLRKLSQFMDQNKSTTNIMTLTNNRIVEQERQIEDAESTILSFEVESGMYLKNPIVSYQPPSAFAYMKPTFQYQEQEQFIQTNWIKNNSYPNWNYKSYNFTVPMNQANRDFIEQGRTLEFEVFHKAVGASDNLTVQETSHLIGVAFVPLKPLIEGSGRTRITGLFDVVPKDKVYQSTNSTTKLEGIGKIKVCINSSVNIKKLFETKLDRSQNSSPLRKSQKNLSFGNQRSPSPVRDQAVRQSAQSDLENNIDLYNRNLTNVSDEQLGGMHDMNMTDLEMLNAKIKEQMATLNRKYEEETGKTAASPDFGHTTFKTDVMRNQLTTEVKDFRKEHLKKEATPNPFTSQSVDTFGGDKKAAEIDDNDDLTRHLAPVEEMSVRTSAHVAKQVVNYDSKPINVSAADSDAKGKKNSPAFGASDASKSEVEEAINVFENDMHKSANDETVFDLDEMKRIEKILQQKK